MRAVTIIVLAVFCMGWAPEVFARDDADQRERQEKGDDQTKNDGEDPEEEEDRDAVKESWARVFTAPDQHTWEFDAGIGWMFWSNAYGAVDGESLYRLRARYLVDAPVSVSLALDHSRQSNEVTPLTFRNQRTGLIAGAGLHHWMNRWLLGVDVELGAMHERRAVEDAVGTTTNGRLQPVGGAVGRAGVSLYGTASLSVESGIRIHPDATDWLLGFHLGFML
ncbi:MAG: hypothetical protein ACOCV2_03300 [Persicimonas sp.]